MRRTVLLLAWLLTDILLFHAAYAIAYFMRVGWIFSSDLPLSRFMGVVAVVSPFWLLSLITTRTFALTRTQATPRNAVYILYACVTGAAFVALTYYFLATQVFSRLILFLGMIISFVLIWLWHIVFEMIQRSVLRKDPPEYPTLVIGATRESRRFIETLEKNKSPLRPVAIIDGSGVKDKEISGVPVVGKLNRLEETLKKHKITHLIQCSDLEQSINLLGACREHGITYLLLPSVLGIVERDERIESVEGHSVTVVSPERGRWQWFFR